MRINCRNLDRSKWKHGKGIIVFRTFKKQLYNSLVKILRQQYCRSTNSCAVLRLKPKFLQKGGYADFDGYVG